MRNEVLTIFAILVLICVFFSPKVEINSEISKTAGKAHLTLFTSEQEYVQWFQDHKELQDLKVATNFNVIKSTDPRFGRYHIDITPAILLQNSEGRVIYAAAGKRFPKSAKELNFQIRKQIATCPWLFPKPKPKPKPAPKPAPVPTPTPSPDPDDSEDRPLKDLIRNRAPGILENLGISTLPMNPLVALILSASGLGLGYLTRKNEND